MKDAQQPRAAALSYNPDKDQAPRVVASGRGELARKLIETANQHDVPVHQDPALVETLLALDLGREIPAELYQVVAEILVFVRRLDQHHKDGNER